MYACAKLMGGLGNRLFQIAFLLGFCARTGHQPYVTRAWYLSCKHDTAPWQDFLGWIQEREFLIPDSTYVLEPNELAGHYIDLSALAKLPAIHFDGYFQTEKYFKHVEPMIRYIFRTKHASDLRLRYPDLPRCAFLHVRRGDFVNNECHYIELEGYYKRAIARFPPDTHFLVVSNDPAFCTTYSVLEGVSHSVVFNMDEIRTLGLMSLCGRGGICANSSFSWWGGWLNECPGRLVVFPSRMFPHDRIRTDDLVPDSFVVEEV